MDAAELKDTIEKLEAGARGFRTKLALKIAKHPNTATGYVIATFPLALIGLFVVISWFF